LVATARPSTGLTTQPRDDVPAPCGAVHLAKELSMSPLRRRLIEDMQIRNLSGHTQRVYVQHVVRFARYFRRSPEHLGPTEIRTYLLHLTQERRLAASSIIVTVSALRFFYTVGRPKWPKRTASRSLVQHVTPMAAVRVSRSQKSSRPFPDCSPAGRKAWSSTGHES
jgi:Phage integrase, N-terminal SAM-like domain